LLQLPVSKAPVVPDATVLQMGSLNLLDSQIATDPRMLRRAITAQVNNLALEGYGGANFVLFIAITIIIVVIHSYIKDYKQRKKPKQ
jgi:hypothetical protein